ncbi:MAG: hypothetical protein M3Y42_04355 [Actinomycetota bacterium]|nr:hypothetical protein [Actinomycetota bacterium]MDQ2956179.1 hypothetical protein [Actinomycetota bacterium]
MTGSSGLADRLLDSALDITELLLDHVVQPALDNDESADFTKEISEIAMLLRLIERASDDPRCAGRVDALAGRIAPIAHGRRIREQVVGRPSRAIPLLLAHACLHKLGYGDAGFHELALSAVHASAAQAEERVPYRLLDSGWIRHMLLGDSELAQPALEVSPIARGVDLLATTIDDAYAFSHALPYATDFGRLALPEWADNDWLSEIADALILKALDEDDLDLLGELLMAPALLRRDWSACAWFGWQLLIQTWQQYGFVPGPGLPPAAPAETGTQASRRVLGTVYHTTLVGGLLVASVTSYGHWPPALPPAGHPGVHGAPRVTGTVRAWQRHWQQLPPEWQSSLAAVPAGIALHRALSGTDVVAITDCLRGPWLDLLPSVLVGQSVEFLNRLAILVGS